ncbi:unnamed protein product [Phytophthora fragariaefolia]|uniref:Unnamed protein product n=1 Tax=Phytophthora fragariaefolia TaxID=1490495 RepID=A0A9W6Y661_9STRA|nr:unnamed protein product [Phytophthora fragariaefolia]
MAHKPRVTPEERGRIKGLHEAEFSASHIAARVGRSRDTVRRVVNDISAGQRTGRPPLTSDRELRRVVRTAAAGNHSASQVKEELSLKVSVRTIQRVLSRVDWLQYSKMDNTLDLTPAHKLARRTWAAQYLQTPDIWASTIFSDEKKWNLDGPDGYQRYWRDIRRPARRTIRRQTGGGSVMVWGGFSATGKTKLAVLVGRQNSDDYVYTLSEYLLPYAHLHYGTDYTFQQDYASIHTSQRTKEFFAEADVKVME